MSVRDILDLRKIKTNISTISYLITYPNDFALPVLPLNEIQLCKPISLFWLTYKMNNLYKEFYEYTVVRTSTERPRIFPSSYATNKQQNIKVSLCTTESHLMHLSLCLREHTYTHTHIQTGVLKSFAKFSTLPLIVIPVSHCKCNFC